MERRLHRADHRACWPLSHFRFLPTRPRRDRARAGWQSAPEGAGLPLLHVAPAKDCERDARVELQRNGFQRVDHDQVRFADGFRYAEEPRRGFAGTEGRTEILLQRI